jgi:filamentous hemagglutinin family protein
MKFRYWLLPVSMVFSVQITYAEGIATDGSMGAAQTLSGSSITIPQTLGSTVGNNLFHSFSDFNINTGQIVTFTGADNLQNVISRVTGNDKSIIDGTLKSDIKNADFYFINPNGITFNSNASVDVPAAFHVTTADKMDFSKNGGVFYADLSKKSQLSSESPAALGFLGTSKVNNGLLDFNGAKLTAKYNKSLDFIGNNIEIKSTKSGDSNLKTQAGTIRLVAINNGVVNTNVLDLPNQEPSKENAGHILINGDTDNKEKYSVISIDTSGDGSGRIALWSDNIFMNKCEIRNDNTNEINSNLYKGIHFHSNNLTLTNQSQISSSPLSFGNAASVFLNINSIINFESGDRTIDKSGIFSYSDCDDICGVASNIYIKTGELTMTNFSYIRSDTSSFGNAGRIEITAEKIGVFSGSTHIERVYFKI